MIRLIAITILITSVSSKAYAIEPVSIIATLASAIISPIVCKEIECTKEVHVHIEKGNGSDRLREMRDSFKWEKPEKEVDLLRERDYK